MLETGLSRANEVEEDKRPTTDIAIILLHVCGGTSSTRL